MPSSVASPRTLSTELMACLGQDDMTDLHLLGTDGQKIPAFRTVLACRSDVFRKMLVGEFKESTSDVVKLNYKSDTLRAVVEYCITDNVKQFDGRSDEGAARGIVELLACAHFLNLPILQHKAQALALALLEGHRHLACAIYDEAGLFGEPTEFAKASALTTIRKYSEDCFLSKPGILALQPGALCDVIGDDEIEAEEIALFRAIQEWVAGRNSDDSPLKVHPEADRISVAKELVTHIRLSSIEPNDLVGIVRESGLVEGTLIYEALESHALLAQNEHRVSFGKKRRKVSCVTVSGAGTSAVNGIYEDDRVTYDGMMGL